MIYRSGQMWDVWPDNCDLFIVLANSTLTKSGALVMGAGIAREARDRFPGLDKKLGEAVRRTSEVRKEGLFYGLLVSENWPASKLALLQTKYHWMQPGSPVLIEQSLFKLWGWLVTTDPTLRVHLPFPGIGQGGLSVERLLPSVEGALRSFPNVTVWTHQPLKIVEKENA